MIKVDNDRVVFGMDKNERLEQLYAQRAELDALIERLQKDDKNLVADVAHCIGRWIRVDNDHALYRVAAYHYIVDITNAYVVIDDGKERFMFECKALSYYAASPIGLGYTKPDNEVDLELLGKVTFVEFDDVRNQIVEDQKTAMRYYHGILTTISNETTKK